MIDRQYDRNLSVADLASALFISPDYLREIFRGAYADSPMQYLIRRRIEVARELLEHTDLPVRDVGRRCGINNPYYFSRLFRRITGRTPSECRGH